MKRFLYILLLFPILLSAQTKKNGGSGSSFQKFEKNFEPAEVCITTLSGRQVNGIVLIPEEYKKDTVFLGGNNNIYTDSVFSFVYGNCLTDGIDFEIKEVCVISQESENGILGYRWDSELNAAAHDVTGNIFPTWNTHINGAPDEVVTITNNWSLNDLDFPVTGVIVPRVDIDISSQELYVAHIYVDQDMTLYDINGNTGEHLTFFLQDCNKDMLAVDQTTGNTSRITNGLGEIKELCKGFYKIAIQISDFSVYGGFFMRYSTDGGQTFVNFPMSQTFTSAPKTESVTLYCYADGTTLNKDGSVFTGKIVDCELPCYPINREPLPDVEVNLIQACDDVTGDPADYVSVTIELVTANSEQTAATWINYGDDDTQAEYEVQGSLVNCATGAPIETPPIIPECEHRDIVLAYAPMGDSGVNVERWITNASTTGNTTSVASDHFTGAVDYSLMPSHINGAPDGTLVIESDLLVLDQNNARDQMRYWTYLYTTEPIRLRELFNRAESVDYYLGSCCVTPTYNSTGEYLNTVASGASFDISLQAGIHYIGGLIHDFSAYSGVNYQYSTDGGTTWTKVPASWLYSEKPTLQECQVERCITPDGVTFLTDISTGQILGSEFTLKRPTLCSGEIAVTSSDPLPVTAQDISEVVICLGNKTAIKKTILYSDSTELIIYKDETGEIAEPVSYSLGDCDCELQNYYVIEGVNGSTYQSWTTSAIPHTLATGHEYTEGFTGTDSEGYPSHANESDATITHTLASTINVNTGAVDQGQTDFYLYLPEGYNLREWTGSADAVGVWSSDCGGDEMTEVLNAPYTNTQPNPIGYYDQGIYRFRLYHSDVTVNGNANIQYQDDNGTWRNVPTDWVFTTRPKETTNKGYVCSGILYNRDKDQVIDETDFFTSCEKIECSAGGGSGIIYETETNGFCFTPTGGTEIKGLLVVKYENGTEVDRYAESPDGTRYEIANITF